MKPSFFTPDSGLVEPKQEGDLGRFMQSVGRRYVRYINDAYERTGTLWEGRFKSAIVSRDEYLITCSRYIELNPVRAGMVRHPRDYRWSSYHGRALGQLDPLLDEDPWYVTLGNNPQARAATYAKWLEDSVSDTEWEHIRKATQQGRVVGSESFQEEIGGKVGRRLVGETRGRPKGVIRSEIVLRPLLSFRIRRGSAEVAAISGVQHGRQSDPSCQTEAVTPHHSGDAGSPGSGPK